MGGCPMGEDPATSVVDPSLRHHEVRNLFVIDGSVFPTSLGVNPSLSVYGIAHWATEGVAAAV
jgi:choline dehydrogenase-like flavoprotein